MPTCSTFVHAFLSNSLTCTPESHFIQELGRQMASTFFNFDWLQMQVGFYTREVGRVNMDEKFVDVSCHWQ